MPRYLSVKEYAALKGVHYRTVYRWIHSGHWYDRQTSVERCGPRTVRIVVHVSICTILPTSSFDSSVTH